MSRASAKITPNLGGEIPPKPEAVVAYEADLKERKRAMVYGACRSAAWKGHFPLFLAPEILGEQIADNLMNQVMQQMIARQSKIVVPPTKVITP